MVKRRKAIYKLFFLAHRIEISKILPWDRNLILPMLSYKGYHAKATYIGYMSSLVMPNGDPRDEFFYPTITLMIDSYILTLWKACRFQFCNKCPGLLVNPQEPD